MVCTGCFSRAARRATLLLLLLGPFPVPIAAYAPTLRAPGSVTVRCGAPSPSLRPRRARTALRASSDAPASLAPIAAAPSRGTPWRTLLRLCRPDLPYLAAAFVSLAVAAAGDAALPALQGAALNTALGLETAGRASLRGSLLRLLGVGVGTAVFTGIRGYFFWVCGARLVARLRSTLFAALLAQPQSFHDQAGPGELSSRLATDCVKLGDVLSLNVNVVLRQVLQSVAGVAIVTRLNGRLAGLVVAGVALRTVFAKYYSQFTRKISQAQQDALAESSGVAEQCLSLIKVVRSHGNAAYEEGRYTDKVDKLRGLQNQQGGIYGVSRVFNGGVNAFLNVAILALGATFVATNILPKEALTSFVLYVTFISDASGDVADQWSRIQEALGAATEVFDYLEPRPLTTNTNTAHSTTVPPNPTTQSAALSLEAVSFAYPSQPNNNVLTSLSITIPKGQRVAIVGGSGSGKSTIFALALRFYAAQSGRVLLGGTDISSLPDHDLRQRVAWVQQEPPLFPNATLFENIAYGLPGCTMVAVTAAAREANAYDFITATPHGFATRLGAAGASLSGGQKQRVALARALVRDPDLLLLDEATSALDPESQLLVEEAIARAATHCTVLFTTHKVAQARGADRILVLAHGRIVEDGTHAELLRLDGAYAKLVRAGDNVSEEEACVLVDMAAGLEAKFEECFEEGAELRAAGAEAIS